MSAHGPAPASDAARTGPTPVIGRVGAPGIHIMSWNIRRPVPAPLTRVADRWTARAPRVRALLSAEQPTVLCAQEVVAEQIRDVRDGLGRRFGHLGRGRGASGGGEACPIFYDTTRLDLLGWDQSALSDTPGRPGSMSWGNLFPRVLVSAHFRDRATGHELLVLNTHLDPLSRGSRVRSARAVRELLAACDVPALVAGDLNAGPSDAAVRELLADGSLVDSWVAAESRRTDLWGTYAAYREPRRGGTRIDWILATSRVRVTDAAINPLRYGGGWPSDHLPVQAVVRPAPGRDEARDQEGAGAT
ncbi:endonuclease/exonuclease/phosphatase family protein [Dietzia kunjamensis]|uniref:endonuclease/exonuclease/phosphatase family protein n=1 Tax=Dietzia kunjamensis TaxID=322509 RepID=UPI002DB6D3DC|nr:endonuclease/exonuclease/phosphatase family protein [Dietzia kunjamensis]MEB8324664.1 endonuclease/exonuclease/phosphatase family protein [Dietzia kunjamensis]